MSTDRRPHRLLLLVGSALLLASCGGSSTHASAPAPKPVTVVIRDFKYHPATLTVRAGARVTWRNEDSSPHTATTKGLSTHTLGKGESRTLTLRRPGRYAYVCVFHAFMHGTVVVRPR
jgi:plastocyanin